MEEANEISAEQAAGDQRWFVLPARAVPIGLVAALAALGSRGVAEAVGALAGAIAAGIYAVGYFRSHLSGAAHRQKIFESGIALGALARMVAMAAGAAAAYSAGRTVLIAYLASFGVAFAVLIATEIPRIKRQLSATAGPRTESTEAQTTNMGVI